MSKEIKALTGLRGIAALLVMLYHFTEFDGYFSGPFPRFMRRTGYLGVDVFFVLSGFVMALSYAKYFAGGVTAKNYRSFIARRIARIYPLYVLITIVFSLKYIYNFSGDQIRNYHLTDFFACLFMIQSWGFRFVSVAGATWSLSTEFFAYLVFPWLVLFAVFTRRIYAIFLAGFAAVLIYLVAHSHLGVSGPLDVVSSSSFMPLLRCLSGFSLGLLGYRISLTGFGRRLFSPWPVALLLIVGVIITARITSNDLAVFAFFLPIVLALYYQSSIARLIFANPVIHQLGVVSYSLYLVHPFFSPVNVRLEPIIERRIGSSAHLLVLCAVAMLTWSAATFLYHFVEVPGRTFLQNAFANKPEFSSRKTA